MKTFHVTCLLVLFAFVAKAQKTEWKYLSQKKTSGAEIQLVQSTENEIVLNFTQTAYGLKQVTTENGEAYIVKLPKGSQIQKKGAPDLAKLSESLIIPDAKKMSLEIVSSDYVDIENVDVAPSKGVLSRDKDPKNIPFEYGEEYQKDEFFPSEIAYLRDPYIIRDFRGQTVVAQPYQYNPVKKVLRVYTNIVVRVVATEDGGENVLTRKKALKSINSRFGSIYSNHFLNYKTKKYTPLQENGGKLLIITYDSFADEMQPFVEWKKSIGFDVEMVNYSTIGSSSALKSYVQNYYDNNGLTYLLLVGDHGQVPSSRTSAGDSDNNYGYTVGNDHYIDLFVGRFSAENAAQVTTQVNRTIYYERDMPSNAAHIKAGIGIASNEGTGGGGDDGQSDEQHMNHIENDLEGYGYSITRCYQNGGTASQLSNLVNSGTGIINYVGHGGNTSWAAPRFTNSNVNALTNTDKYPFVISVACVVGNFTGRTCFSEAWLRATDNSGNPTGAVVFCGSTINQSWASPMCAQDEMNDLLVANTFTSYGAVFMNGVFQMIDEYGNDGNNMADTWTCFGDPSLQTRTPERPDGPQSSGCGTPSDLVASDLTQSSASLSWGAVTDASSYDVQYKAVSASAWTTKNTTGISLSVSSLDAGTEYEFQVRANCAEGSSDYSASVAFTTAADPNVCDIPTGLVASDITSTSAVLSWNTMANSNSYDVRYKKTNETDWTVENTTSTSVTVTALESAAEYEFQVRNNCAVGTTDYSASTTFTAVGITYCASQGDSQRYEYIAGVKVGDYTNNSEAGSYSDFTGEVISLSSSNSVTLTPGFTGSSYNEVWRVWIDFNKDGDFNDSGEEVIAESSTSAVTGTINVPSTFNGRTRMRVSMRYRYTPSSCDSFSMGEVEDYTVEVVRSRGFEAATTDFVEKSSLTCFPNPTNGVFTLRIESEFQGSAQLMVFNSTGQVKRHVVLEKANTIEETEINLTDLPAGIYILSVRTEKGAVNKRIVLE